ncbi:LIM/homeobox protein Lhx3-like isoform X2 [Pomacea canaliculata]|uniref:LIM/homeobox protein Lhx3-like isoform X2 n=1 Tax=Pomacea canaliculata TaxID=400727 RepID=UPI000D7297F2|nr:LIM/homeobox protein Lhx3-like isoform X2 [Pomacea canaliculata]
MSWPREHAYGDAMLNLTNRLYGPPPCAGCGQSIQDEFILRVQGHLWHAQCLRCAVCQVLLTQSCYVRGNRVFCRVDFFRLFGASCAGCGQVISPSEVVRRAHDNIYHVTCFCCLSCGIAFNTGDEFYLRQDGRLLCTTDFRATRPSPRQEQASGNADIMCQNQPAAPSDASSVSISEQEEKVLREVYSTCKNPSRDFLQQISASHRLDMRSVRAWFHSQRLRDRKQEFPNGGAGVGSGDVTASLPGGDRISVGRVLAPPGSFPLPIVNDAMCPGQLPSGTRTDVTAIDIPFAMTSSCPRVTCLWPLSPEVWSEDFVPPNVNLDPCDLQNGEVCCSRRYLPQSATTSVLPPEFDFTNGRGSNCGVQQQQQPTARVDGAEPPWINC